MRIRRRPPGQPLSYLLPSDPPTTPRDHRDRLPPPPPGDDTKHHQRGEDDAELHLHHHPATTNDSAADLGDARSISSSPLSRPALPPQDGAVERSTGRLGAQQQQQQQQQQVRPADGRCSLENGHHRDVPEPAVTTIQGGEHRPSSNGVVGAAMAVTTTPPTTGAKATTKQQQETKQDNTSGGSAKRAPRGPGVLMEGSRCSRKNGRGWRCSQPTLVGYALCQYHLGKGRARAGISPATGGRSPGQLGRTERANKQTTASTAAAAVAPATAAAPKADVPAPPTPTPSVQHC